MSTLMASYTSAMSRLPVLPASSRGSRRPSVAFQTSYSIKSRRPLTVTCALPFTIPPTALLCPVPPPDRNERWDIKEEDDHVTLWLQVPGVSAKDIEVTTSEHVLEIKRKVAAADVHGVGAFHIRLLMTELYDANSVTADLREGMLEVIVYKDQQRKGKAIELGAPPRGKDASNRVADETKLDRNNKQKAGRGGLSS